MEERARGWGWSSSLPLFPNVKASTKKTTAIWCLYIYAVKHRRLGQSHSPSAWTMDTTAPTTTRTASILVVDSKYKPDKKKYSQDEPWNPHKTGNNPTFLRPNLPENSFLLLLLGAESSPPVNWQETPAPQKGLHDVWICQRLVWMKVFRLDVGQQTKGQLIPTNLTTLLPLHKEMDVDTSSVTGWFYGLMQENYLCPAQKQSSFI